MWQGDEGRKAYFESLHGEVDAESIDLSGDIIVDTNYVLKLIPHMTKQQLREVKRAVTIFLK